MARRLSWSDVRGGVIATIAVVLLAVVTLKYARIGALHGDTFRLYALVGEARGVQVGSEVWLSGEKIGKITGIKFREPTAAAAETRLEIQMEVLGRHRPAIHKDAVAQVRSGGSFIGAPVVYLTPGTIRTSQIADGDTVKATPQSDVENAAGQFGTASREFPVIISNVKLILGQLEGTRGTVGAIFNPPPEGVTNNFNRTRTQLASAMAHLTSSRNLQPRAREELMGRVQVAMARSDSVRALLSSPNTSLGRFRRDSTLVNEVADVRNELTLVRADVSRRLSGDSSVTAALQGAENQMTLLFADIKQHPLRYIRF